MKKTNCKDTDNKIAVSTSGLSDLLGCGRDTAVKIGTEAHARIKIGRRVLWNVAKIQNYLDNMSETGTE